MVDVGCGSAEGTLCRAAPGTGLRPTDTNSWASAQPSMAPRHPQSTLVLRGVLWFLLRENQAPGKGRGRGGGMRGCLSQQSSGSPRCVEAVKGRGCACRRCWPVLILEGFFGLTCISFLAYIIESSTEPIVLCFFKAYSLGIPLTPSSCLPL